MVTADRSKFHGPSRKRANLPLFFGPLAIPHPCASGGPHHRPRIFSLTVALQLAMTLFPGMTEAFRALSAPLEAAAQYPA